MNISTPEKTIRCGISYDEWYPVLFLWVHSGNVENEGEGVMLPADLVRKYVEAVDALLGVCEEIASEDPTSLGAPLGKNEGHEELLAACRAALRAEGA